MSPAVPGNVLFQSTPSVSNAFANTFSCARSRTIRYETVALSFIIAHLIESSGSSQLTIFYNVNKLSGDMYARKRKELLNVDIILKSILRRQIPFLIGGTITGTIITYYYGFLFAIIVNSAIWYGISYVVNRFYWKNKGLNDQKYLFQYAMSKINSRKRKTEK
jgi:ABC-type transport system involved in Fe-S cluster assembly fused permease/ATPase subunit